VTGPLDGFFASSRWAEIGPRTFRREPCSAIFGAEVLRIDRIARPGVEPDPAAAIRLL